MVRLGKERCITGNPEWGRAAAGWGIYEDGGARELGFSFGIPFNNQPASVGNGSMAAFSAPSWAAVDISHAAALAHDGVCGGVPGLRLHFAPDFYAAYLRDPDGNKVSAVCRGFMDPNKAKLEREAAARRGIWLSLRTGRK